MVQPTEITRTQYTKCCLFSASWGWASNARNMDRSLILNKLNKKCIMLVSLYWYTMMHGQQNIKFYVQFKVSLSLPAVPQLSEMDFSYALHLWHVTLNWISEKLHSCSHVTLLNHLKFGTVGSLEAVCPLQSVYGFVGDLSSVHLCVCAPLVRSCPLYAIWNRKSKVYVSELNTLKL
jgi:hypothetical protein